MNESYFGNPNLKRIGVPIEYTEEQIIELQKCADDPIYFIENYCYIITIDHGLQLFKLYDCQKEKIDIIHNNRKVVIMESRQAGKTTTSAAYILWYTLFNAEKTVAILANKETTAREILSRYRLMYENLPLWMQHGIKTWNKGDVELENLSKVFTAATTAMGIRSRSVSLLYIDEMAIIPNTIADAFLASVYPVISAGTTSKILITSTPLGYNHFWKMWNDAQNNLNGFIALFIPYWKIPGRDEKWADEQRKILGDVKFAQEVLCSFLGSSYTLIKAEILAQLSFSHPLLTDSGLDIYEQPIHRTIDQNNVIVEHEHAYLLIGDTSKGVGGDYSAFSVIDITHVPYKIVAKYRDNNIAPLIYPSIIYKVARHFNNAFVLLEINSSEQVAHILHNDYEYDNILSVQKNSRGQTISSGFAGATVSMGVFTDKKVKRIGCTNLKSLIEEKKLLIPDADIISELSTFVQVKDSYAADEGYNDDLAMTLVLFAWLATTPYFGEMTDINLRHAIYQEKIQRIEDEMMPIVYDDGQSDCIYVDKDAVWYDYGVFNSR